MHTLSIRDKKVILLGDSWKSNTSNSNKNNVLFNRYSAFYFILKRNKEAGCVLRINDEHLFVNNVRIEQRCFNFCSCFVFLQSGQEYNSYKSNGGECISALKIENNRRNISTFMFLQLKIQHRT